ncbi:MAG: hypothetical protein HRS57_02800 [Mycoplasmataceae bacterium]|nr:hypothetical protein [Mycoplasmataceae bacterium]
MFGKDFDDDINISIDELLGDSTSDLKKYNTDNDKDDFDSILNDFIKNENSNKNKSIDSLNDLSTLLNIDEINSSTSELFSLDNLDIDDNYNNNDNYNYDRKRNSTDNKSDDKIDSLEQDINNLWKMSQGISSELSAVSNDETLNRNNQSIFKPNNDIFRNKINIDSNSTRKNDDVSNNNVDEFNDVKKEIISLAKKIRSDKDIIDLFTGFLRQIENLSMYKDSENRNYNFISRRRDYIYESIKDVQHAHNVDLKKLEVLRDKFYSIKEKQQV